MVKDSDDSGSAPGKEVMIDLLKKASPCVLLLDELVAFYRQLDGSARLSAGTFESNMSFIQSLTESVKAVPQCDSAGLSSRIQYRSCRFILSARLGYSRKILRACRKRLEARCLR